MIVLCFGNACKNHILRYTMLGLTVFITILFGGPSGVLFYIHVKNFMAGKTTNERFARNRANSGTTNSTLEESMIQEGMQRRRRGSCGKCREMCFNR